MNTPETAKSQVRPSSSSSKYLTPCRTFGLKRKSTSPRTPSSKLVCKNDCTDSPLPSIERHVMTPLQEIENKVCENICIKNQSIRSREYSSPLPVKDVPIKIKRKNDSEEVFHNNKLLEKIKSINSKIEKINNLKRNEVYTKRHNIFELKNLTEKWKKTCKEVVLVIYEITKSNGHEISLKDILDQHNIPYDYIGFSEENMDFN